MASPLPPRPTPGTWPGPGSAPTASVPAPAGALIQGGPPSGPAGRAPEVVRPEPPAGPAGPGPVQGPLAGSGGLKAPRPEPLPSALGPAELKAPRPKPLPSAPGPASPSDPEGRPLGQEGAPAPRARSPFRFGEDELDRVSLFPILHEPIWQVRKKLEALRWTAQSVNFDRDGVQWAQLPADEKHTISMQLAFFAQIDELVLRNLDNFREEVPYLEARMVFSAQEDQECVHMESYNLQITALIGDAAERRRLLEATRHLPVVASMHSWAKGAYSRAEHPLGLRMVAAVFVEGVLFSASFAIMQWLRERNILPGIAEVNSYIARDELVHTKFTALLVASYMEDWARPRFGDVAKIFDSAIRVVDRFVDDSLPVPLVGMNAASMRRYVRFQADSALKLMGYPALYEEKNPFPFMDKLALNAISKANFFEEASTQYQQPVKPGAMRLRLGPPLAATA